jgi:preprotein translocase subunit SecD
MYLGLDLRGGVHFMLQVDMQAALTKKAESLSGDIRSSLARKEPCAMAASAATARPSRFVSVTRQTLDAARRFCRSSSRTADGGRAGRGRIQVDRHDPAEAARKMQEQASSRTSPPCTTASMSWAWPSR